MKPLLLAMPGNEATAARLAEMTGSKLGSMVLRTFPDGETYLRLDDVPKDRAVALVCTLAHPNEKFLPLIFAADTLRQLGARRVGLVAPYLGYMRQDCRFHPGEAVTSRSFARLISKSLDWLLTIDPHLHRYHSLGEIYSIPARALHAGPALAAWIKQNVRNPFLIGPDDESKQWVGDVASICGAGFDVLQKTRLGDRSVAISAAGLQIPSGSTPVLLDDIVASGATMLKALEIIRQQTSLPTVVVAVHGLADPSLGNTLRNFNVRLVTTNTVSNPESDIDIIPLLAAGLKGLAS